ncbi:MAG: M23 family metallopeptidase [Verrucomicrobia bacterium]|nr:M23 family metallopeptidase [Verrucomicrobiota bacterium]MCH8511639.1 M23 family metallopeptidase [Kiritimatiellia bacterium]
MTDLPNFMTFTRPVALRAAFISLSLIILFALRQHHRQSPQPSGSAIRTQFQAEAQSAEPGRATEWAVTVDIPDAPRGLRYTFPTPQTNLQDLENPAVYMPTASGRVISAHYGSTRTNSAGRAVFHEGVDIAPTRRDRAQNALDPIFAVADGIVAYANRIAGNSTYGIYVVLTHEDEFGVFYTLYSHLSSVASGLQPGQVILKGEPLGVMGHTSSFGIPVQRAHLHFEIGVINNAHFDVWYRGKQRTPNHGNWHGHNLTGIDPLLLLLRLDPEKETRFSMLDAIGELPVAYSLAFQAPGQLDYFRRHPMLWEDEPFTGGVMVVDFCQAGTPLSGRSATEDEARGVTSRNPKVLETHEALGRNGRRKIARSGNNWTLTTWGNEWLEILLYRAGR